MRGRERKKLKHRERREGKKKDDLRNKRHRWGKANILARNFRHLRVHLVPCLHAFFFCADATLEADVSLRENKRERNINQMTGTKGERDKNERKREKEIRT